jgi:hypothetical protein
MPYPSAHSTGEPLTGVCCFPSRPSQRGDWHPNAGTGIRAQSPTSGDTESSTLAHNTGQMHIEEITSPAMALMCLA